MGSTPICDGNSFVILAPHVAPCCRNGSRKLRCWKNPRLGPKAILLTSAHRHPGHLLLQARVASCHSLFTINFTACDTSLDARG